MVSLQSIRNYLDQLDNDEFINLGHSKECLLARFYKEEMGLKVLVEVDEVFLYDNQGNKIRCEINPYFALWCWCVIGGPTRIMSVEQIKSDIDSLINQTFDYEKALSGLCSIYRFRGDDLYKKVLEFESKEND